MKAVLHPMMKVVFYPHDGHIMIFHMSMQYHDACTKERSLCYFRTMLFSCFGPYHGSLEYIYLHTIFLLQKIGLNFPMDFLMICLLMHNISRYKQPFKKARAVFNTTSDSIIQIISLSI